MIATETLKTIPIDSIIVRKDLYPRFAHDPELVQQYAKIPDMPAIVVNQLNELIDGLHRKLANEQNGITEVLVKVIFTHDDNHLFHESIRYNSQHGKQFTQQEKATNGLRLFLIGIDRQQIATDLGVDLRTVDKWTEAHRRDQNKERNRKIVALYSQGHTQDQIAQQLGIDKSTVCRVLKKLQARKDSEMQRDQADPLFADFEPRVTNIWYFKGVDHGLEHPGTSHTGIIDNLLWRYTSPNDLVLDPFAGAGTTFDVAEKRGRRAWLSDRKPIAARTGLIRKHDLVVDGLPGVSWPEVKLAYLDPPYWAQTRNQYSKDPNDLANMSLEDFTNTMIRIIRDIGEAMVPDSYLALLIRASAAEQTEADKWLLDRYHDHLLNIAREIDLPVTMRFQIPSKVGRNDLSRIEWAKNNKQIMVKSRELIVWRVI